MFTMNSYKRIKDAITVKKILYFIVLAALVGNSLISIDVGIMHLNLYRLSLAFMIIFLALNKSILKNKSIDIKLEIKNNPIIKFHLFWFIYAMISLTWVLNIRLGIRAMFFLAGGLFCIIMFTVFIRDKKDFEKIFDVMFIMIIVHNILGWFELITTRYLFIDIEKVDRFNRFSYNIAARRPVSIFANTNDFATLMTFGVFVSFLIFLNTKKLWMKVLSSTTVISCIILISRSKSRANMLGLLLGILTIAILMLYKKIGKKALYTIGLLSLVFIVFNPHIIKDLLILIDDKILNTFKEGASSNGSNTTRMNLMKNGIVFLKNTFGFGTGAGNIEYWMENRHVFDIDKVYNIHNWWLEILVGYGVLVFIGYVYIYYIKTKTLIKAYLKSTEAFIKNTALCLFGFMMSYIIASSSSSSNIDMEWTWVVWSVIISFVAYIIRDFKRLEKAK